MSQRGSIAPTHQPPGALGLMVAAVGIVYGDIGTSPLYTLKEVFSGRYGVSPDPESVLGVLSLIVWSLVWIVSLKYVVFMLRADNQGEGGIMALMTLARRAAGERPRLRYLLMILGLVGTSLFYGDSMITPAISVLSAMEGLEVGFPKVAHWVVPGSLLVLVGLFLIQRFGTSRIGVVFGPLMVVWFVVLAVLGISGIVREPTVLGALNPYWAVHFFIAHPGIGVTVLGAVVLAVTGAEAVYADLGHFGRRPIARAWFALVLPGLVLNYFGQGALLLDDASAVRNPFYLLAPGWALLPLVLLSTCATVVASQAVISGAFSLTRQAIQLGFVPRMHIRHTSSEEQGQFYIATVNWMLLVAVVALVAGFGSSGALAAAYGVAVTGTMLITTLLVAAVMILSWRWPLVLAVPVLCGFLLVDLLFFSANLPKVLEGGAFPVLVGVFLFLLMTTWKRGRGLVLARLDEDALPVPAFVESIRQQPPFRPRGNAVFLTSRPDAVPHALLHNLLHNQVLHARVVLLTVLTRPDPRVPPEQRMEVQEYGEGICRMILHFGFMERADVPAALTGAVLDGMHFEPMNTTYFLSRETVIPSRRTGMAIWREALFAFMLKNANGNLRYFNLPLNRVVELGTQVEI